VQLALGVLSGKLPSLYGHFGKLQLGGVLKEYITFLHPRSNPISPTTSNKLYLLLYIQFPEHDYFDISKQKVYEIF
jgi:hypothetical protein